MRIICYSAESMDISLTAMLVLCSCLLIKVEGSTATDAINATQSVKDGESLVSAGGNFELGFFTTKANDRNWYVGIWYKNKVTVQTVVWVANRDRPLHDQSGVLKIVRPGQLVLLNSSMSIIWSTNMTTGAQNPVVRLLDSGNLVLLDGDRDMSTGNFLWQSFDYPYDTLLPGMKFGVNFSTGLNRNLTSWKGNDDPSLGNFTQIFDTEGCPERLLKLGSVIKFRYGPLNGVGFSGTAVLKQNNIFRYVLVFDDREVYFSYELVNSSIVFMMKLSPTGELQRLIWNDEAQEWNEYYFTYQTDNCDHYAMCGVYGSCNIDNSPLCGCLKGFSPKVPGQWYDMGEWSGGCVRRIPLNCSGDGFIKYSGMKLPQTNHAWYNRTMSLEECQNLCSKNCSCTAYAKLDVRPGGSGCLIWLSDLIDLREAVQNGQDIYVRIAAAELGKTSAESVPSIKKKKDKIKNVVIPTVPAVIVILLSAFLVHRCKGWQKCEKINEAKMRRERAKATEKAKMDGLELHSFDAATIGSATNNFSDSNRLGQGGFGSVFKGTLESGQEIAVKRLCRNSRPGIQALRNEVSHVAKLQHRNLVRLLGFCAQEEELMLIYEYMPNKSLDFFLFDEKNRSILDWPRRFHIIDGIARGLLYLHQDSRLRIVHRDLKAGNVLLDSTMNAKIADFGLARSFVGNETEANTKKVVGTYGYMSPEYAIDGFYSLKSDVFSFGVLVLEIVTGKRNRGFSHPDHHYNLLGHAWILHMEGRSPELVDESLEETLDRFEALRSIHVGLLCVQRRPEERPSMSSVVLMLGSDAILPQPNVPGFFNEREPSEGTSPSSNFKPYSINEITITDVFAR